ncbi:MAG: dockerin type I repeat-containing protein, partial [Muribaculaceae bacterium]|nr:dockerin type I repeat-containing protein [Muribaculaceae bacterium]
ASDCIAAGFTLELPNGLFRVNGSEIDYAVTLDKNFTADHVAVPNLLNNKDLKVAIYSTANTPFAGGSTSDNSTLLKVNFRAYGMTSGTYQCKVKNIELVNSNHELQRLSNVSFTITVSASIGDVNGDGVVSGADVTALYNKLLSDIEPSGDADVNGDGVVNGADVTALYNSLLGN